MLVTARWNQRQDMMTMTGEQLTFSIKELIILMLRSPTLLYYLTILLK